MTNTVSNRSSRICFPTRSNTAKTKSSSPWGGDRESVVLTVEDNGPGIKDKQGVFELYAQEDENLLQRKGQGTGIGLYFVKLLCKDLGIDYEVQDREGGGTRFILIFNNKSRPGRSEK